MNLLFCIVLIILVMMRLWDTVGLIGLLPLASYLIALPFLLLWLAIAASIEFHQYVKRRRLASNVGLDAVAVALEQELTQDPAVTLAQNRNGEWVPRT
jgi:hypothetical protein